MNQALQFLYMIRPARLAMLTEGPTAAEQAAVGEHFAYLQTLQASGTLVLAGRTLNTDESSFGIAIFYAESEAAAERIMRDDPAVRAGVMLATLYPYRIALLAAHDPIG
ncbi:MAG TPA: YciI family protein [Herpetosiphonaceae bacterium]|nr:YciI family protein [Herpetosiphonaceae bacterium]